MDYKETLIKRIDQFTIGIVEEFKEAEVAIFVDSRFSRIFKNKDYEGHLATIRKCKKDALDMNFNDIELPADDRAGRDLVRFAQRCIIGFSSVCDNYIQLQLLLQSKAEGEKVGYIEYKKQYKKLEESRTNFNNLLRELDIAYSDYTFEGAGKSDEGEYLTYSDIVGDEE